MTSSNFVAAVLRFEDATAQVQDRELYFHSESMSSELSDPRERIDQEQAELRAFVTRVEAALSPGFAEVLSEETRRAQRSLLILSFVLILIVLDAVRFSGDIEFIGAKFAGTSTKSGVVLLSFIICSYLELLVAIRCYSDWHLWRLRNRKVELDTKHIERELATLRDTIHRDIARPMYSNDDSVPISIKFREPLFRRIFGFGSRPIRAVGDDSEEHFFVSHANASMLDRLKRFGPQYTWFYRDAEAYEKSRRARVVFEVYFPLTFGIGALVLGVLFLFNAA